MAHFVFGRTEQGGTVTAYVLSNRRGARVTILDYGCTVQSLLVPDARGGLTDVVLGYDTVAEYEKNGGFAGAVIGRVANRIGAGAFTLNGKPYFLARNDGPNHLHGGFRGFDKQLWKADEGDGSLTFSRRSPDGEEHYPGNLDVTVTYSLSGENELRITYDAETDADTVVNLTNHSYFNLHGGGTVLSHTLQVFAEQFAENDPNCLPTGRLLPVEGTPFDFRKPKELGRDIDRRDTQLQYGGGYDHNYVLSEPGPLRRAAVLSGPETGIELTVLATQPGLQVYSGNALTPRNGKRGGTVDRRCALCLETQVFPNAMACPHFPSPILRKAEHYREETVYRFGIRTPDCAPAANRGINQAPELPLPAI